MTDISAIQPDDHEIVRYERAIREAESAEIELRERRAYAIDPGDVLLWMFGIPSCVVFLGACVLAIASN